MSNGTTPELTVKERYTNCKQFECPRFVAICESREDGSKYFSEGSIAYSALVRCNNWTLGLSDGDCVVSPVVLEPDFTL